MWKILLSAAWDVLRGKDSSRKWADPNCIACEGSGWSEGLAPGEWCHCCYRNVNTTLAEKAYENRQRPAQTHQVYQPRDWRDTAAARALADIELQAMQRDQSSE